jgi:histidinol-phosphatase (PHP family)
MNIFFDMHTHSDNSPDGNNSVMFMCETAIQKNLNYLTITDHCEINAFYKDHYNFAVKHSFFDIKKAKSVFKGQLEVLNGIELGQATQDIEIAEKVVNALPYDFVLASVHNVKDKADFAFMDYSVNDPEYYFNIYLDELMELINWGNFDVLAHFTYPLRYIVGIHNLKLDLQKFEQKILKIFDMLIKNDKGIEINTSGLRQPYNALMPDLWCLKLYKQAGGEIITIGSDAHRAEHIGANIDDGIKAAIDAGFAEVAVFENRKPTFFSII